MSGDSLCVFVSSSLYLLYYVGAIPENLLEIFLSNHIFIYVEKTWPQIISLFLPIFEEMMDVWASGTVGTDTDNNQTNVITIYMQFCLPSFQM